MNTYRVKVSITVEVDAFTPSDASEIVLDDLYDLVGVTVIETTVDSVQPV